MADNEYEDLDELKKELSGKKDAAAINSNEDLYAAVKALSAQIVQLTEIFKLAIGQMTAEDDVMQKVSGQLNLLLKNDQDLARGLLLVLEIEKDKRDYSIDKPLPLRRANMRFRRRLRRVGGEGMGTPPGLPDAPAPADLDVEFPDNTTSNQPPL